MPVIAARGARVAMAGCFLDVSERYASVESGRDEGVSEAVRVDLVGDPCLLSDASDDPVALVAVEATVAAEEDWSCGPFVDGQVDGPTGTWGHGDESPFATFAFNEKGSVTSLESNVFDVGIAGF